MPIYVQTSTVTLPYPGLRPFRRDEFEIFFGREEHVAKLAEMLQARHFVAVVGPSGCGKSSLVTAGLLPQLADGHVVDIAGPWYEATIRPGDRPISRLAQALLESGALPDEDNEELASRIGFLDSELRRGPLGLIHALEGAAPLCEGNLLIVVDQFEEIFRFRHEKCDQEADAFIALLLETVRQAEARNLPIYVMLTMRSDYLGACNQFQGLPEAISESQFLTPRPNREQRHAAIDGPAAMFGGEVEPALINRLLNDMGDDPDQLPIMQHALMRMWSLKAGFSSEHDDEPVVLTTDIYDEVGGWHNTLSNHADEAFEGLGSDPERQRVAEMLFRSLTHRGPNQNDVRRPVSVKEVAEVAGVSTAVVKEVVNVFRRADRCFLTPGLVEGDPHANELDDEDILDISHESLIRQWARLREWAEDEGESAADYARLEDAALRWKSGAKGYLQSPELDVLLKRYQEEQWTPVWAKRYGDNFELALQYLEQSQAEKQRLDAEAEAQRNELAEQRARADEQSQTVVRFRFYMGAIAIASVIAIAFAITAIKARGKAESLKESAQGYLADAYADKWRAFVTEAKARDSKAKTQNMTAKTGLRTFEASMAEARAQAKRAEAQNIAAEAALRIFEASKAEAKAQAKIAEAQNISAEAALRLFETSKAQADAQAKLAEAKQLEETLRKEKARLQTLYVDAFLKSTGTDKD